MPTPTAEELASFHPTIETPVWERYPESTTANAQEVYPGVGEPLSYDISFVAIEHGFRGLVERLGLTRTLGLDSWPHFAGFSSFYGRAHINISMQRELVKWTPGGDPDAIDEQLFGLQRPADMPRWRPTAHQRLVRLRTLAKLLALLRAAPRELAANEAAVEGSYQRIQDADLPALSDAALMRQLDDAFRRDLVTCELHITHTTLAGSSFERLRVFLVEHGFDDGATLLADLCTGLDDVESAKPGRAIARLAGRVRAEPAVRALVMTGEAAAVPTALRASHDSAVRAFLAEFDAFLRRYGYRGVREVGLDTLVWALRPEAVVNLLRAAIDQPDGQAEQTLAEQRARRAAATAQVTARLNPVERARFRMALNATQAGVRGRELSKSQWARITHVLRLLVREIGRRLAARGLLATPDEVFLLRLDDVREAMAGRPAADLAERVARQREELALCRLIETDERFSGYPVARLRADAPPPTEAVNVLRGLAVSPGRVTAPARVVRELRDEIELQPGEVLVCPFTDAAWTPLFFQAAAVVMDLGGPLSHGATVAREYGLPAVVNVKTGTSVIRDGQLITVDGALGEVWLNPSDEGRVMRDE